MDNHRCYGMCKSECLLCDTLQCTLYMYRYGCRCGDVFPIAHNFLATTILSSSSQPIFTLHITEPLNFSRQPFFVLFFKNHKFILHHSQIICFWLSKIHFTILQMFFSIYCKLKTKFLKKFTSFLTRNNCFYAHNDGKSGTDWERKKTNQQRFFRRFRCMPNWCYCCCVDYKNGCCAV